MTLFLITFFAVYGGMHAYFFLKVRNAFSPGMYTSVLMAVLMLAMTSAPVIVRFTEREGFDQAARVLSYAGYLWMGIILLFFSFSIVLDCYQVAVYVLGAIMKKNIQHLRPTALLQFSLPLLFAVTVSFLGYFEAVQIRTEKVTIRTSKIPASAGRLRIAQISDVHTGLIVREERIRRIVTAVKNAGPDLLVSTGDLVDGQIDNLSDLKAFFREIHPRYGKYAITGNHEFYAGLEQALSFTEEAGFTLLRGRGITVDGTINIAGVDDPAGKPYGLYTDVSEKELLAALPPGIFTLLLKHRPLIDENAMGLFDLQLSGHTHKGQIFPFSLITKLYYPIHAGFERLDETASLYVSRGSGTWGPPVRFLSPPEVTIIDLIPHADP